MLWRNQDLVIDSDGRISDLIHTITSQIHTDIMWRQVFFSTYSQGELYYFYFSFSHDFLITYIFDQKISIKNLSKQR